MHCLFAVMWCKATELHTHLSESLTLFTLTAENAEHLVSFIDDEPMLSVATDLFLLALSFRQFFQMANLPTLKTPVLFSVVFC